MSVAWPSTRAPGSYVKRTIFVRRAIDHARALVLTAPKEQNKNSLNTAFGGSLDLSGQVVHAGEQAMILPGAPGQPNVVTISKILPEDLARRGGCNVRPLHIESSGSSPTLPFR